MAQSFGSYLKALRISRGITQRQLAEAIGRHPMLISGMESRKNNPPADSGTLGAMMEALRLTAGEQAEFLDHAALCRGTLPRDMADYLLGNRALREFIRAAQQAELSDSRYQELTQSIRAGDNG